MAKKVFTDESLATLIDETKSYVDSAVSTKANSSHSHSISNITNLQSTLDTNLASAKTYTDTKTSGLASTSSVSTSISNHNTSTSAHNDIRDLITGLTNRLNTLANSDDTTLDQMSEVVAYIKNNKNLIDGITTSKVNVSDIINNLTTNVSNKPLSAAQGVAIKSLIDALQTEVDGKAASNHTHNYAGSSSAGGAATSANKLNTNAGSTTQPVYFSNGVPVKTTYTLGKSVPSDAKFTDTTYSVATTSADGLMSSGDKKQLDAYKGSYALGSMKDKTVADLQSALNTWLTTWCPTTNASAHFYAGHDWISNWNSNNSNKIVSGNQWTVTVVARYDNQLYVQLRISTYGNKDIYYVHRSNGTWGTVHRVALKDELDAKQATITGGATTITSSNLTAGRALVSDSNGKVGVSAVTSTELGYLDGVTSNIQTQLDNKVSQKGVNKSLSVTNLNASNSYTDNLTAYNFLSVGDEDDFYVAKDVDSHEAIVTGSEDMKSAFKGWLDISSSNLVAYSKTIYGSLPTGTTSKEYLVSKTWDNGIPIVRSVSANNYGLVSTNITNGTFAVDNLNGLIGDLNASNPIGTYEVYAYDKNAGTDMSSDLRLIFMKDGAKVGDIVWANYEFETIDDVQGYEDVSYNNPIYCGSFEVEVIGTIQASPVIYTVTEYKDGILGIKTQRPTGVAANAAISYVLKLDVIGI